MHLVVYTLGPARPYAASLLELERQGKFHVTFIMSRPFYQFALKLYHCFGVSRFTQRVYSFCPTWKDIFLSFVAPFYLFFVPLIYISYPPYDVRIWYFLLLKKLGKKIIYFHSWPYWDGKRFLVKPILGSKYAFEKFLHGVSAVSVLEEGRLGLQKLGADAVCIPHCTSFVPVKKKKHSDVRVLFVGRLTPQKGVVDLLHILEEIGGVTFVVVGEGELASSLVSSIISVEHHGYVTNRKELANIYASCDVFVLNSYQSPSWQEWYGIALLEALMSGLSIVSVAHVGPRTILQDSALLFADRDLKTLEKHLRSVIGSSQLRASLSRKSLLRSRVFTLSAGVAAWKKILGITS